MTQDIITTNQGNEITKAQGLDYVKALVLDALSSPHSKAMYGKALDDFFDWRSSQGEAPPINKAFVTSYKAHLEDDTDYAPSTINQKLSAIRKLAMEAADNGLMDPVLAQGVQNVKGVKSSGRRLGNWLNAKQAQKLIRKPDITTLKGLRDRAILAVMIGAGLRRSEVAGLTFDHIQLRQARWVIVDLVGKRNRTRSVPIPHWAKQAIEEYAEAGNLGEGNIFRSINKGDNFSGLDMTPQAVADVVKLYAGQCGFDDLAAHDLRRTYAKLAKTGGADMVQIQLSLGHASIQTTELYLNTDQDLTSAPCDFLRVGLQ
jgi:site-specific recombinase XerD